MYPDPAKIVEDIDRLISENEDELEALESSLPIDRREWSWDDHKAVIEKHATTAYLREHGRTDALVDYSYRLLVELLALKDKDLKNELAKNRRHAARIEKAETNFHRAVLTGYEIARKKPTIFRSAGKYKHLAELVCKELDWKHTKVRSVRRDLAAANVLRFID